MIPRTMAKAARHQTTDVVSKLYDGKLRLERRNGASVISARTFIQGKLIRKSTGESNVHAATKIATDWYLDLRTRERHGEDLHGKSFAEVTEAFLVHADLIREVSEGQRRNYKQKWSLLKEHFDGIKVTNVDTRFLLALREKRSQTKTRSGEPIKPATLKRTWISCGWCCGMRSTLRSALTTRRNSRPSAAAPGKSCPRRGRSLTTTNGSRSATSPRSG